MTEKYTYGGIPAIEEKVDGVISQITDEIVARLHPKSIILIGSFGRGEATVVLDDGKLEYLSDCDVIIISNRLLSKKASERLASELTRETGLEVGISGIELSISFMLSRIFPGIWKPSIDSYEMKYGSRVIYGENYLDRIPDFKPEDIPAWEGIRLLLNRMMESLKSFSIDYLGANPAEKEQSKLSPWIGKIILACQDALLLSIQRYHHSYRIRNELLHKTFPEHFNDLADECPQFLPLTLQAIRYRLNPDEPYSENTLGLWFDVADLTDEVFKYIIKKDMALTFDTYPEFQEKYLRHPYIRSRYYRGLTPFPPYQNMRSTAKMLTLRGQLPRFKSLTRFWTPWTHIMYSTIPLIYFGLSRDGRVDEISLAKARRSLSLLRKLDPVKPDLPAEWEYIKRQALDLWWTVCY